MCIPPINDDPKIHFRFLKNLLLENNLNELSIGMSSDYDKALSFNPTYIRLGTIFFGNRNETKNIIYIVQKTFFIFYQFISKYDLNL